MRLRMQYPALAALILASYSLQGCGTTVQPVVLDCYTWPQEGQAAYEEIRAACGGAAMPNCPNHREWRSRLRNLKDQIDATSCQPLGDQAPPQFTAPVPPQ